MEGNKLNKYDTKSLIEYLKENELCKNIAIQFDENVTGMIIIKLLKIVLWS